VKRFRRGLVFEAHRLLYHSTVGVRVIKKKKKKVSTCLAGSPAVLRPWMAVTRSPGRTRASCFTPWSRAVLSAATLETTSGQMAPPKSGLPLRMPSGSGGIPGRVHFWEVPFALMLSPGRGADKYRKLSAVIGLPADNVVGCPGGLERHSACSLDSKFLPNPFHPGVNPGAIRWFL